MTWLEDKCRIADALRIPPEATIDEIVWQIEFLWKNRRASYKLNSDLLKAVKGMLDEFAPYFPDGENSAVDFARQFIAKTEGK
jgi:hypothetical protein